MIAHCRQFLTAYKVSRAVQFVTEVPTTASGKIMRRMLSTIDDGRLPHPSEGMRIPPKQKLVGSRG
jgi:acyl-coenzyme A synthetase/AMP-(fatty) acid ligase